LGNLIQFNKFTLRGVYAEDMVQKLKQLLSSVDSTSNSFHTDTILHHFTLTCALY
jgi:hypothetical protein